MWSCVHPQKGESYFHSCFHNLHMSEILLEDPLGDKAWLCFVVRQQGKAVVGWVMVDNFSSPTYLLGKPAEPGTAHTILRYS